MSITLYFAKLNLISEDIFALYDKTIQRDEIALALYYAIKSNMHWLKENTYIDNDGVQRPHYIEYSVYIENIQHYPYIVGWIYKNNNLYYKTLNKNTNTLTQRSTTNTDGNRFVLDLNHGLIGYHTSTRFGYKEFIEAMENIINLGESALEFNYRYKISLCVSDINLKEIKQELKRIGRIKELKIRLQPPNPSEELLDELQKRCDNLVKDLKDANVTEVEYLYSTSGYKGIDVDAHIIQENIDNMQRLYSQLSVEESIKKGYVSVNATTISGQKYTSGDSKPIKRVIETMGEFLDACNEVFRHLL